jgi:nucleotide-binding universal stress UspA family protein
MARYDDECRERARLAFEEARAGSSAIVWSEVRTQGVADLVREALYADLLVLGQYNPAAPEAAETPADLVPQLLLESGRPALVIPWAGPVDSVGRRVLVAWKPTREAARAVSASLPWLRGAERVAVACDSAVRSDILGFLRGHGVEADAVPAGDDDAAAGEWLLSSAADFGADLLVMGAYGHARMREWIVGGATRTVLQSMTLPVLMVH